MMQGSDRCSVFPDAFPGSGHRCPSTKLNLSRIRIFFAARALLRNTGWFGTTAQKEITRGM